MLVAVDNTVYGSGHRPQWFEGVQHSSLDMALGCSVVQHGSANTAMPGSWVDLLLFTMLPVTLQIPVKVKVGVVKHNNYFPRAQVASVHVPPPSLSNPGSTPTGACLLVNYIHNIIHGHVS